MALPYLKLHRYLNIIKSQKYQTRYPYSGKLYCGICGAKLKRRIWNGKLPSRKVVWQCSNYIKNGVEHCPGISISEEILNQAGIKGETVIAIYQVASNLKLLK